MNEEWKDLLTMQDVACAQADGWEIERLVPRGYGWQQWDGLGWHAEWQFRARPRQPAMKKVKFECFSVHGQLVWRDESLSVLDHWIRVPSEDKEIEVPK